MNPDFAQRRRVAIALAITVIAVPAAFLLNPGDDPATAPPVTLVGTVAPPEQAAAEPAAPGQQEQAATPNATDPMGTTPVAYLEGTGPSDTDDPATIAIPRLPESLTGTATFRRNLSNPANCQVVGAPFNRRVTVTNLDNSRSIDCINNVGGPVPDELVVLHADAFVEIADLTDAPVPVQITW